MLADEKVDQVNSFSYVGSISSKDDGCSKHANRRITKAKGVFIFS